MNYVSYTKSRGFTIVELLIVIVVIAVLAAITIVAYNGIQARAATSKRDADIATYYKAILAGRELTGKTLGQITGSYWSVGSCTSASNNPSALEPKDLPKTHVCWTAYYSNLSNIGTAAGIDLSALKPGDARGNPYMFDENEGEGGTGCNPEFISAFTGSGITYSQLRQIPKTGFTGC